MNNEKIIQQLRAFILQWQLNQSMLAKKMKMSYSTFKLKLNEKQKAYQFNNAELARLVKLLDDMQKEIVSIINPPAHESSY